MRAGFSAARIVRSPEYVEGGKSVGMGHRMVVLFA